MKRSSTESSGLNLGAASAEELGLSQETLNIHKT